MLVNQNDIEMHIILKNVDINDIGNCKIYNGVTVINGHLDDFNIIGENSYIEDTTFEKNVQINRRNLIVNSLFGTCSYTGSETVIKYADIGKFCSISWHVSCAGGGYSP